MAMRESLLLLALFVTGQADREPRLRWDDFHDPVYPQMARIAHIYGRVVLEITIQPDGTVAVREIEGHPILVQSAKDSVQKSKLGCDGCGEEPHTFSVTYEFKIIDPPPQPARSAPPHIIQHYVCGRSVAYICGDVDPGNLEVRSRKWIFSLVRSAARQPTAVRMCSGTFITAGRTPKTPARAATALPTRRTPFSG